MNCFIVFWIGFLTGVTFIPFCILGGYLGRRTAEWMNERDGNLKPIDDPNFDETKWINEPPPWPLGGSMGENWICKGALIKWLSYRSGMNDHDA